MSKAIPIKQLRIGPFDFAVEETENINDDGLCNWGQQTLVIQKGLSAPPKRQRIWHESFHAMLFMAGIESHNERVLDTLASGIMAALRDNPELSKIV